ncbi:uncharacterized protein LOC123540462 [Mercenaria mercenaria]|uniref:uncharacterized protein LOC123540462 n=1 Tax=Mercenaria mercenaria TaxID=6596 RepID=UPI00234ECB04|nr:uncharacterized protein LOC123540462 [Mercenaria mercenaria]
MNFWITVSYLLVISIVIGKSWTYKETVSNGIPRNKRQISQVNDVMPFDSKPKLERFDDFSADIYLDLVKRSDTDDKMSDNLLLKPKVDKDIHLFGGKRRIQRSNAAMEKSNRNLKPKLSTKNVKEKATFTIHNTSAKEVL